MNARRVAPFLAVGLLLSACVPEDLSALASQVQLPSLTAPQLQSGSIGKDMFLFEDNVVFDGTVEGDLFAGGDTVDIGGTVEGSVYTYGTTVNIHAKVNGGVFVLGREVEFGSTASVGQGVVFAGMLLHLQEGSTVAGGVTAAGYQVLLDGAIGQFVRGAMLRLRLDGTVGAAPQSLHPGTRLMAALLPAVDGRGAQVAPLSTNSPLIDTLLRLARELVTLLFFGLLASFFRPTLFYVWADRVRASPLVSFGYGIFVLIGGFVGAGLGAVVIGLLTFGLFSLGLDGLAMTALGIGGGALLLGLIILMLFAAYGTKLIVGALAGRWVLGLIRPAAIHSRFGPLLLGAVIYVLVAAIPYVGAIVAILSTLLGLGAVWLVWRDMRTSRS